MALTLGTAGHIDHGKTALIRALTGTDTDRLPEERARGISIALGYAQLALPSGNVLSVVDVPGHERFVRTMVAGATGIDLFLLCVAADDGVMPQTREHLAVLRALGVDEGVVAVTKSDVAQPPELDLAAEQVPVSAKTGAGLDELRAALDRAAARVPARRDASGPLVLHVDRVFTIRGAGTVVTGTLWSGRAERGMAVRLLPGAREARVRGVQVHDAAVEAAGPGQRVALNLAGVGRGDVARGDVVVAGEGVPEARYVVEAELDCEPPPRVMVHHGTRETAARAVRRGERWSLRCEGPLVVRAGDRLVLRSIAPPDTIGGGVVLEPEPRVSAVGGVTTPQSAPAPVAPRGWAPETEAALRTPEPPLDAELDAGDLAAMRAAGRAVRVGPAMHFHADVLDALCARLVAVLEAEGTITLARARDELQTSRKYAQALLEHLDGEGVTLRRGDERVLRRRSRRRAEP
jgi:selenocysteine-specific elongation factor